MKLALLLLALVAGANAGTTPEGIKWLAENEAKDELVSRLEKHCFFNGDRRKLE